MKTKKTKSSPSIAGLKKELNMANNRVLDMARALNGLENITQLAKEEVALLMFSLGQSTGEAIKRSEDKDIRDEAIADCPYHKLAQKLAESDVFVQKKESREKGQS